MSSGLPLKKTHPWSRFQKLPAGPKKNIKIVFMPTHRAGSKTRRAIFTTTVGSLQSSISYTVSTRQAPRVKIAHRSDTGI
eukprot:COSAG01_NODE_4922_length_4617_cov_16.274015_2_plen_80_part_00